MKHQVMHRLFAKYVWWRTGATHWMAGRGNYTFDPSCPLCRIERLIGVK